MDGTGYAPVVSERPDGRYVRAADGRRIAFVTDDGGLGVLSLVNEDGSHRRTVADRVLPYSVSASPDGRRLAYAAGIALKVAYVFVAEPATGATRQVGYGYSTRWSADGAKLAAEDDDEIWVLDVDTQRGLFTSLGHGYNPQLPLFSPDGGRIAFAATSARDDRQRIFVGDLRSGSARDVGPGGHVESWSPDGSRLAVVGASGVVLVGIQTGERRGFLPHVGHFRFSPDWRRYAFSVNALLGWDLYIGETGRSRHRHVEPSQCAVVPVRCLAGGSADEHLLGGPRGDVILAGFGSDTLSGRAGNDRLEGEFGRDVLLAGTGNDHLLGGPGSDRLEGGAGRDTLRAGPGDDDLRGGDARDVIFGAEGRDAIVGGRGSDILWGDADDTVDEIRCGSGLDFVRADRRDAVAADCEHVRRT